METGRVDPLERIADALEKLASDPEVEIEFGYPLCPHCGKMDPEIEVPPQEGTQRGYLSQFFSHLKCMSCGEGFFMVTESYSCHRTLDTVQVEITQRRAGME